MLQAGSGAVDTQLPGHLREAIAQLEAAQGIQADAEVQKGLEQVRKQKKAGPL